MSLPAAPPCDVSAEMIAHARSELAACDPALAAIDAVTPVFGWRSRSGGYPGLLWLIVGQQVSMASAAAIWARLEAFVGEVSPDSVLAAGEAGLRACGFSGPKVRYALALATAELDEAALASLPHQAAVERLTELKGVGRWTAESYMMTCAGSLDAWPAGDIALQEAVRWMDGVDHRPGEAALVSRAEVWRPFRAVAAHLLWAHYLAVKAGEATRGGR